MPARSSAIIGLVFMALAQAGCGTLSGLKDDLSSLSSAISLKKWTATRAQAGLSPDERPVKDTARASEEPSEQQPPPTDPYQAALENAYRQGVRDAVRQLSEGLGRDPRWTWVAPVVQEVWIPAQVVNGVMIPGHREWVMIRPGQFQAQFGLPLGPPPQIQPTGGPAPVAR
jgi:hypothetical protein